MTATSLFDLLASTDPVGPPEGARAERLARFAEKMAESSLSDLERVRDYEQEFAHESTSQNAMSLELLRSVWDLYAEWARDAEQVLSRVRPLTTTVVFDRLEDAYGSVMARLSVTPEQIVAGEQQVGHGDVVSAAGMRDELRARRLP